VKALLTDSNEGIDFIKKICMDAKQKFLEIQSIWIFGSFAKHEATKTSDIDILIIADTKITNPLKRIKPYYFFFSEYIPISFDLIVVRPEEKKTYCDLLSNATLIA